MADAADSPVAFVIAVECFECGKDAVHAETVAPGALPVGFGSWSQSDRDVFIRNRSPQRWRFIYEGVEAGNGHGDDIKESEAALLAHAFTVPLTYPRVHTAGLDDDAGFCPTCAVPYCFDHWNSPGRADGTCPRGHWRSLDPHWSPG
ncbi:hypothetical protein K1X13_05220 [Nocardioides sp. WL0053]|uniref:Uncharacterized protein n=1 Tax=Nocardioides jiangsuensis TaxID=2866161 RepID=A0ABS7RGQ0_9ACTN|nr:hypothetical protein [Nocardioides jiangsuensis]MBY9074219.1 hypothetical protein [Nocardioides jiangsuensis]